MNDNSVRQFIDSYAYQGGKVYVLSYAPESDKHPLLVQAWWSERQHRGTRSKPLQYIGIVERDTLREAIAHCRAGGDPRRGY